MNIWSTEAYIIIGLVFLSIISIVFLMFHICLSKRLIIVKSRKSSTGRTLDHILVIGRSYEHAYEIPAKQYKVCGYYILILPTDTQITLQVLVVQCKISEFSKDSRISVTYTAEVAPGDILVDPNGFSTFPIFDNVSQKVERKSRSQSFKTYSICCAICLENFPIQQKILLLHCRHGYHRTCIIQSLFNIPHCPICQDSTAIRKIDLTNETPLIIPDLGSSYGSIGTTERT